MNNFKRWAAPLAVFGLIVATAAVFTVTHVSLAQTSTNSTGGFFGRWHMMKPAITGTVGAINGNSITLNASSTTYTVDATNANIVKFANNSKTNIKITDIQTGDTLTVFGTVNGNSVTAKNIMDGQLPPRPVRQQPAASGSVSAINGNTITLTGSNGTTYTVDASNVNSMVAKQGVSLGNTGIQVGDQITVFGTVSGTNISAAKIMDGSFGMKHGFGMGMMMGIR